MSDETLRMLVVALITSAAPILIAATGLIVVLRKQTAVLEAVQKGVNGQTQMLVEARTGAATAIALNEGEQIGRAAATKEAGETAAALAAGRREGMELSRPAPEAPAVPGSVTGALDKKTVTHVVEDLKVHE